MIIDTSAMVAILYREPYSVEYWKLLAVSRAEPPQTTSSRH